MSQAFPLIWKTIRQRLEFPPAAYFSSAGSLDLKRVVFESLIACKSAIAEYCAIQPSHLNDSCTDKFRGVREYLVDFAFTTYPPNRSFLELRDLPAERKLEIVLTAESEVGVWNDMSRSNQLIIEDFVKLLDVASRLKLMVYRVPYNAVQRAYEELEKWFGELMSRHRYFDQNAEWMFVGVPWVEHQWPGIAGVDARVHIVEHAAGRAPLLKRTDWAN
jgi:hypothetical protein